MIDGKLPVVLVKWYDHANWLLLTARQYEFSSEKLAECGKMVGGWTKQTEAAGSLPTARR